jgi:hypothetical protein
VNGTKLSGMSLMDQGLLQFGAGALHQRVFFGSAFDDAGSVKGTGSEFGKGDTFGKGDITDIDR